MKKRFVTGIAALLVCGGCLSPKATSAQPPLPSTQPPNIMEALNKEAEATDPIGIHTYIERLMQMFPAARGGEAAAANALTDRLARAELTARNGNRKLIPETEIVEAFNDLMRRTEAPAPLRADLAEVESARRGWEKQLPAVISRDRNGTFCYPGEAFFVLDELIENVGARFPRPSYPGPQVSGYIPPVRMNLEQYFAAHSSKENTDTLERLARQLGI